jgi:type II secretory pathway component GspD/PulD (secretin)
MKTRPQPKPTRSAQWFIAGAAATLLSVANVGTAAQRESPTPPATGSNGLASQPTPASASDTNLVTMNFHATPLDQVLSHLSETAGFIINIKPGTSIRGKVDIFSAKPVTKEEALDLLDTALNQNGLGAIRNGRTLTIVSKDEIKTQNIPVFQGSDPDKIPMSDRIVTQIMPVRFVEAAQLVKDLAPLVSLQTPMTANESGNSIIMTDTQANIHKVAEIVRAIDMGAEDFVEVKVFRLTNSSPVETAELLTNLFPDESKSGSSTSQSPFAGRFGRFFGGGGSGGFPGFGGGSPAGGSSGGAGSGNQNQRIKKRNRVIAVPDQRTTSVIVSANRDLMEQIADVVTDLDANPSGKPHVTAIPITAGDPNEILTALQDIFASTTANKANSQQNNDVLRNRINTQSGTSTSGQSSSSSRGMSTTGGSRGGGGIGIGP